VVPEIEKPAPETVAELTVTVAVPVEDSVIDCEVAEFTLTFPKLRLDVLMLNVGTAAFSCRANVCDALPALADSVAVWAVATADTVAEKLALVAPAATVTEAGTVTDELLLARVTLKPALVAAAFSVTLQASVPAPVMDELVQEIEFRTGTPAPLNAMAAVPLVDELLLMVSVPVAAPAVVGSN
jgi:hypothetical protein